MDEVMHRFFQEAMPYVLEEARREGYKKGHKIGIKEGKTEAIVSLFRDNIINEAVAAEELDLSIEEFRKLVLEYPKE